MSATLERTTSARGYAWPLPVAVLADAASDYARTGPTFDRGVRDGLWSLMTSWDDDDARVWLTSLAHLLTYCRAADAPVVTHLLPLTRAALASLPYRPA